MYMVIAKILYFKKNFEELQKNHDPNTHHWVH